MKNSVTLSFAGGRLLALMLSFPLFIHAANVDWDGAGDANTSGLWETDTNWTADAPPTTADHARLLDVTSGTREVTISSGSPQTINQLTITQTTVGAFNVLNVEDDLTISGTGAFVPFVITATAGQDSIVTNIASGVTLHAIANDNKNFSYGGILNLSSGSVFKTEVTTGDKRNATIFGGPVNANGAGAQIILKDRSGWGNASAFNGAVTVSGTGSSLAISTVNAADAASSWNGGLTFNGDDGEGNAVRLAAGTSLTLNSGNGMIFRFNNRVLLDEGAQLSAGVNNGHTAITYNINQGLRLEAGAVAELQGQSAKVVFGAGSTTTLAEGSKLTVRYWGDAGGLDFTNHGSLTQDGADVFFDWAAPKNNNPGAGFVRRFTNSATGEWTLDNGSVTTWMSSTGRPSWNFTDNLNAGTLRVKNGSSMGFSGLRNTGTIALGSSTLGVSDAQVEMGSAVYSNIILNNGHVTGGAVLNILGDTLLGRSTAGGRVDLTNGTNGTPGSGGVDSSTDSMITIGDGTIPTTLTLANNHAYVTNATDNTIDLKANATLHLKSVSTGVSNGTGVVNFTNRGDFIHAGTVAFQGNFNGARTFAHDADSTYRIDGQNAKIIALPGNGSGVNVAAITFTSSGLITGSGAHDRLTYTNSTGHANFTTLGLTMSGGEITPGNGTNGTGVSSIGTLEFVNTNIALSGAAKLSFDIGGLGNDDAPFDEPFLFDQILMETRTFSIGAATGSVLDIWMVNNFVTPSDQSYVLIDASGGSVTGSFSNLLFNGVAVTDEYTVIYLSDRLVINLSAGLGSTIPEPSTAAVVAGLGAVAFSVLRRRRVS